MIRRRSKFGIFFFVVAVVLGLVTAIGAFQGSPAHAQEKHNGTVSLTAAQIEVYEGAAVLLTLTRSGGPMGEAVTVRLQSWEQDRTIGFGVNPSSQIHYVTIEPWQDTATLTVTAYVDGVSQPGFDPLEVNITDVGSGYQMGNPSRATIEINDPPGSSAIIGISSSIRDCAGGRTCRPSPSRRSGDLSSERNSEPPARRSARAAPGKSLGSSTLLHDGIYHSGQ